MGTFQKPKEISRRRPMLGDGAISELLQASDRCTKSSCSKRVKRKQRLSADRLCGSIRYVRSLATMGWTKGVKRRDEGVKKVAKAARCSWTRSNRGLLEAKESYYIFKPYPPSAPDLLSPRWRNYLVTRLA